MLFVNFAYRDFDYGLASLSNGDVAKLDSGKCMQARMFFAKNDVKAMMQNLRRCNFAYQSHMMSVFTSNSL
jgi:hypothetical protein